MSQHVGANAPATTVLLARRMRQAAIFLLFTAAYFLSYFFRTANAVIAPDLSAELGLDAARLGLMTSLFFASFAAAQIPLGIGLDRWGPRWVTPGLMLVGALGALLFASATQFALLALGRALIGVGMAGVLMGSLKIFSLWFGPQRYATVSGILVGVGASGALVAATPLARLTALVGWRAVFVVGAVVTAVIALSIMLLARNTPPDVVWQRAPGGLGGLRLIFADRRFWQIVPFSFFLAGGLLTYQALWAGPYLFDVLGMNAIQVGNVLLVLSGSAALGYLLSGWLCDRFGLTRTIASAGVLYVLSLFALLTQPPAALVTALFALFGFTGGFNVMVLGHARRIFPPNITGQVITAVNLFGIGGTFVLQWLLGVIIGRFAPVAPGQYPPAAHAAALLFVAVGSTLALLNYLALVRRAPLR